MVTLQQAHNFLDLFLDGEFVVPLKRDKIYLDKTVRVLGKFQIDYKTENKSVSIWLREVGGNFIIMLSGKKTNINETNIHPEVNLGTTQQSAKEFKQSLVAQKRLIDEFLALAFNLSR